MPSAASGDRKSMRWVTFDCFGTLVDWNSGFAAILRPLVGDRTPRVMDAYHRFERRAGNPASAVQGRSRDRPAARGGGRRDPALRKPGPHAAAAMGNDVGFRGRRADAGGATC